MKSAIIFVIGAVVGGLLAVVASALIAPAQVATNEPQPTLGGASRAPDVSATFRSVDTVGTFSTTSQGTATYNAASIQGISSILHNASSALTATLPASTTLKAWLPTAGSRVSIAIVNTGTGILTLAGGTGTLLLNASTTKAIPGGGVVLLEIVRKTNTDFAVFMSPAI